MQKTKGCDSLLCQIINTIKKYGKKHGCVGDIEIVGALVVIIAELLALQNPEMQAAMRGALHHHIDEIEAACAELMG
jgi:hypothetical protein